jgi:hypothetical protein
MKNIIIILRLFWVVNLEAVWLFFGGKLGVKDENINFHIDIIDHIYGSI